jgi:hypothetical protein
MRLLETSMSLLEGYVEGIGKRDERIGERYESFRRGMRKLEWSIWGYTPEASFMRVLEPFAGD